MYIWTNHLASDKTCLNCEVGSGSRPEAIDYLLKNHLKFIVEESIKTLTSSNPDDQDLYKSNDTK